jgi:hypothetical protein
LVGSFAGFRVNIKSSDGYFKWLVINYLVLPALPDHDPVIAGCMAEVAFPFGVISEKGGL